MRKAWSRIVSILMALVLVAGMLPVVAGAEENSYEKLSGSEAPAGSSVTVTEDVQRVEVQEDGVRFSKTDTVTRVYEIPEIGQQSAVWYSASPYAVTEDEEDGEYLFTTFEDLQALAAGSYSYYHTAFYTGTEPLVIAASLRMPENLELLMYDAELIVPENVEFTAVEHVSAKKITVNGVARFDLLRVSEALTVNGELYASSNINIEMDTTVSGAENIVFSDSWSGIMMHGTVSTEAELIAAVAAVDQIEHASCDIAVEESFSLNSSLYIPKKSSLTVWEEEVLTIAEGGNLKMDGNLYVYGKLVVSGALAIRSRMYINYDLGGRVEITPDGSLTGKGVLIIWSEAITDPALAISGLDMDDYEVSKGYGSLELRNVAGLTKLAAPVNPEWGYDHQVWAGWDKENDKPIYECVAAPGFISWQPQNPTQAEARIQVYRVGEEEPYYISGWGFSSTDLPEWRSVDSFCNSDPESGTYYFTVQSEGDYVQYCNSDIVKSDNWTYVKPDAKIGKCGGLSWDWPTIRYSAPVDMTNVCGYEVEWYFSDTKDGELRNCGGSWTREYYDWSEGVFAPEIHDSILQECGVGYYYFKVRPLSADITVACNGEWSELSPAYNLKEMASEVEKDLQDVVQTSGSLSDDEIREAVQNMDTEDLKTAMLADEDVVDNVAALEAQVGGAAGVEVTTDAAAFDSSKISIVGANLNNAESAADPIKLVIDKPEKDHVLDAVYDNSVAVKFSMDLKNVEDTENLEVPVKITLPIPNTINPGFLVILHYHVNGDVEELLVGDKVHVFTKSGQKYASFVLDSFSDFTMTQQTEQVVVPTMAMFRMYDPNGHEHFYTGSEEEKNNLIAAGWNYEGVGFNFPLTTGDPVYRLYDRNNTCEHLYTMDEAEKAALEAAGWEYEGIAFNSADSTQVPQYRLHNPNETRGAYHFTADLEERDHLISLGWEYQGIGWYSCWQ